MSNLRKLTCSPEQSRKLVDLGITCPSILVHVCLRADECEGSYNDPGAWKIEVYDIINPPFNGTLPAWTKAELDALITSRFEKPDFYPGRGNDQSLHRVSNPWEYPVFTPGKSLTFKNGAEASAFALIWLLENKKITPADCMAFHFHAFGLKHI